MGTVSPLRCAALSRVPKTAASEPENGRRYPKDTRLAPCANALLVAQMWVEGLSDAQKPCSIRPCSYSFNIKRPMNQERAS
jgi:hypothetical protein